VKIYALVLGRVGAGPRSFQGLCQRTGN